MNWTLQLSALAKYNYSFELGFQGSADSESYFEPDTAGLLPVEGDFDRLQNRVVI